MVPSLPGCVTWGDTVEKALEMIEEAIIGYIQVLKEEGEPIPDDNGTLEYSLQLSA
jgi:antitoxin HicB